jgi:hypothetical protein
LFSEFLCLLRPDWVFILQESFICVIVCFFQGYMMSAHLFFFVILADIDNYDIEPLFHQDCKCLYSNSSFLHH